MKLKMTVLVMLAGLVAGAGACKTPGDGTASSGDTGGDRPTQRDAGTEVPRTRDAGTGTDVPTTSGDTGGDRPTKFDAGTAP